MMEYLENANVSVASDLHVTSIEPANDTDRGLDLLFEVVSGPTLRPALGRLVRDCPGCLGAMRLARDPKIPEPEPMLHLLQSVTYTCKVGKTEVESRVDVVGRALVPECAAGRASAVDWATTPAGREARIECSALVGYIGGLARRQCVLRDHGRGEDDEDGDGSGGHGAQWEEPDFSECVQEEIAAIRDNVSGEPLGVATLEAVRRWLESRGGEEDDEEDAAHAEASTAARAAGLRPREGEPILALAVDVAAYQRKVLGARSLLQLREELFRIVDLLLLQSGPPGRGQRRQRSHAVQDNVAIEEVQALVREQALLWASSLPSPLSSASSSVSSSASSSASSGRMAGPLAGPLPPPSPTGPAYSQMEVHVVGANDLDEAGRAQGVPLPEWVGPAGSRLRLHVSKALAQRSVVAAVVAFKSLHKLLPERSVAELPDSSELEYELASSLVSVSLGSEAGELIKDVSGGKDFAADVVLLVTVPGDPEESAFPGYLWPRWGVACAVTDIARGVTTPGPLPWNTSACATLPVDWDPHDLRPGSFNLRCNCTLPGTIAVLLTSNTSESAVPLGPRPPVALVSGLALCALQAGLAALVLLPRWLGRPSCMLFLKLQSSAASSASAGLFLAGLSHSATNVSKSGSSPGLVAALHCCLLTALAAHLGKLLLLYTELVGVRPLPHLRQSLLAMVAGAPLVGVLCGLVAARSMLSPAHLRGMAWAWGWPAWAPWGTRVCSVFVATAAFILVAFGALLCAVAARLAGGAARRRGGKDKQAAAAERDSSAPHSCHRRGLVRRSCAILLCQVAVVVMSVLYVSVKSAVVCYVFSATSVVLVLRPEGPRDAAARGAALGDQKRGGAAGAGRTPADITSDPTQTEPLTSCSRVPGLGWLRWLHPRPLWRPLRAAAAAVRSNARSYQLVPPRPAGPDTPTPARLGESLCPFIVFTKQDAELESEAAATMPAAVGKEAMEAVDMQRAVAAAEMGRLAAGPGSPTTAAHAAVCTCQVGCPSSVHGHPQRYVSMCPVPCAMAVHVPVMAAALPCPDHLAGGGPGAGAGSVLGVGRDASLLDKDAMALPLQDLEAMAPPERSPSKYLYMRCRPCRAEDGGEYVQHEAMAAAGAAALPPGHPGTLYHNDRAGLERLEQPCLPRHPAAHEPLRPEPVPCYIRGEPGVPLVVSPSRAAPPPPHGPRPRVQVQVVQADVEPTPRARAPTAPAPPPRTHHSSPPSSEDPLDEDVLNRISHDLDYLLSGDPPPASASGPVANGTSATPSATPSPSAIVGSTTATSAAAVIKAGAVLPPP
ncbi:hypothetical protein ONE63_002231 [Megalurothrips usitatus]|uniref:Uncharacterized protein n=1 Tax=Megalurothrips usitatus TaxID=439358 RepID=A0AAV7XDK5_9NEOP|nr:hypothetical protein ONE63_002231 [Megalurothrips usitatus]